MADNSEYLTDVQRYVPGADAAVVDAIVKHLGIALRNPNADAALVSCSDKSERDRVRDSWLKKKLERTEPDADLDAVVEAVCTTMKDDSRKQRVTFYYLAADKLGALDRLR